MSTSYVLTDAGDVANFSGLDGDRFIRGLGGHDYLFGGNGNDTIYGGAGNDSIGGGDGDDYLVTNGEAATAANNRGYDTLSGGAGNDWLYHTGFGGELHGGAGDDRYTVHAGLTYSSPLIVEKAGEGHDVMSAIVWEGGLVVMGDHVEELRVTGLMWDETVTGERDNMILVHGSRTDNDIRCSTSREGMTLKILAWDGNDTVTTAGTTDDVQGMWGNDYISTGAGADTLRGDDGNDTLDGGSGTDRMEGGLGDDTFVVEAGDTVVELAGQGRDTIITKLSSYTLAGNFEQLIHDGGLAFTGIGNAADNALQSNTGNDTLKGGAGNDTAYGAGGNDLIEGGQGNDSLFGEAGADTLVGDAGNDRLVGGAGADMLKGGAGLDTLVGGAGGDRLVFGAGDSTPWQRDIVTGFETGLDRIDLSAIDANTVLAGNQAFRFIGQAGGAQQAGDLWLVLSRAGVEVRGDTNGDLVADVAIFLADTWLPAATDFVL